ncbi:MAG: amino acid adenylation domain-containing protein [Bacteroidota bacterium]|nr:amino acid adenylation domain-containing protein [Bacteroidota bacterium]
MPIISNSESCIRCFDQSAEEFAGREALELKDEVYTYGELRKRSLEIASALRVSGDGSLCGIMAYRSIAAYSGILGALYAGRTYVPLNPRFPLERTREMIRHSGLRDVVVGKECLAYMLRLMPEMDQALRLFVLEDAGMLLSKPHEMIKVEKLPANNRPEQEVQHAESAYLLYTSGSTGKPKGVPVSHKNLMAYLDHINKNYDFDPQDRFSQTFDLTFDLSVHDLFVCWLNGACLVVPSGDTPLAWSKYIRDQKISVWFSVPSLAVMLGKMRLLKAGAFPGLRLSFFCGEAFMLDTALKWQEAAPGSQVINLYGPSEATIAISEYRLKAEGKNQEINGILSIGRIFPEQRHMIVDEKGQQMQTGEKGELLLSGSQVIGGYFQDRENTEKAFVRIKEQSWYRTGDLAVESRNGNLCYLGRLDTEVKISGYRVNLYEIEHLLREKLALESVAAYHTLNPGAGGSLLLFYTRPGIDESHVMQTCREMLPWYMVPEKFIFVPDFIYNANGKIDRNKLMQQYL